MLVFGAPQPVIPEVIYQRTVPHALHVYACTSKTEDFFLAEARRTRRMRGMGGTESVRDRAKSKRYRGTITEACSE